MLILGPSEKLSSNIGGTVKSMSILLDFIRKNYTEFNYIPTNKYQSKILSMIYVLILLIIKTRKSKLIFINISTSSYFFFIPIILLLSISSRKIILRFFGGNIDHVHNNSHRKIKKLSLKALSKCDLILLQTKNLVDWCTSLSGINSKRVYWFPTSRKPCIEKNKIIHKDFSGKFVFISRVTKTKGIDSILEVYAKIPKNISIEIYGGIEDHSYLSNSSFNEIYKGEVGSYKICEVISNYDVLLLPTFHKGEGYPGIIIESLSAGIPVITTNWLSIPEIVKDKYNGFLVPPNNSGELLSTMCSINKDNIADLRINALDSFLRFSEEKVYSDLKNTIDHLIFD